jgi:hypothetical protein
MLAAMIAGWAFSVSVRSASGPFPHQPGKLLGKRVVHFLEDLAGRTESVGQLLGHADLLAALAGK